jgi:hypothetical protein
VNYTRSSDQVPGASATSRWLPDDGEDGNPSGTADSTSMNVGSLQYVMRARTIDEYGRPDGTPAAVAFVGNFAPTLDTYAIKNHDGQPVSDGGTLLWDWARPAREGFNFDDVTNPLRFKEFYFVVVGSGHDHPKEPDGSGVKSWRYGFRRVDDPTIDQPFARSGSWVEGATVNALSDTFRVVFEYPLQDVNGDTVFDNLPAWLGKEYDFSIQGRDTGLSEQFRQYVYLNHQKVLLNEYPVWALGRGTEEGNLRFSFDMQRNPAGVAAGRAGFTN